MPYYFDDSYYLPEPEVVGNNNPSNNPLWELNPLQDESPLSKNNSTTIDAGKVVPSAGSRGFNKPSYSESVADLYGQKLTTGERLSRAFEPLLATLPAALISGLVGGRRAAGRSIQGSMEAIQPLQEERYKTEEARRQMFERDPRLQRSYLDSIRKGFKLSGEGGQPAFGDLMLGNVGERYAAEDLEKIQNPFDVLVQESAGAQLPFKFEDISNKIAKMQGQQAYAESAGRYPWQAALAGIPQRVVNVSSTYEPPANPDLSFSQQLRNDLLGKVIPNLPPMFQDYASKLMAKPPAGKVRQSQSDTTRAKKGDYVVPDPAVINPKIQNQPPSVQSNDDAIKASLDYYINQGKMPKQKQIDTWLQNGVSEETLRQYGFIK